MMNQSDATPMPFSSSYNRRNLNSVTDSQGLPMIDPLSSGTINFSSNPGGTLIGAIDNSSTMSPRGVSVTPVRRKRGRPRKYGRNNPFLSPLSNIVSTLNPTQKRRGRPPGNSRKTQLASSLGVSLYNGFGTLIPHIVSVATGEDIKTKILSFSEQGHQAIVILSGIGGISTVNCKIPSSGGTVTYEGYFDMLSLSGSYMHHGVDDSRGLVGGLNVTLAGPNGHVIGGVVEGVLIAAGPVQVIVGSVPPRISKAKNLSVKIKETSVDPNKHIVDSSVTPATIQPNQNLVQTDSWHSLQQMDYNFNESLFVIYD